MSPRGDQRWWQGAIIYQIYPLSFQDSDGDGIGDLPGVLQRLDYIADLGVDAVWLSPFYRSPLADYGYDVADHTAVDPIFGTLEDFDRLIEAAHARGLKVMLDLVLSHTSDAHPWFQESRRRREGEYADWYVWADPKPDGTPPNNWVSEFGGPAWSWCPARAQYYMHNFLSAQPDLNFHNPEVQRAQLAVAEFWLKRGVDGFRVDAIHCLFHDQRLRSNPPRPPEAFPPPAARFKPRLWQVERYNAYRPEVVDFIKQIRALCDTYGAVTLGEVGEQEGARTAAAYSQGRKRLHMAYNFSLLGESLSPALIQATLAPFQDRGWPCLSVGNHDVSRVASRLRPLLGGRDADRAVMIPALLSSLRAVTALYQGDELALPAPHIPPSQVRDPYGLAFAPVFPGRDDARTPMPWTEAPPYGGFSERAPWMLMPEDHLPLAVEAQGDPRSPLQRLRRFFQWRKAHLALAKGDLQFIEAPTPLLVFERRHRGQRIRAAFNLSAAPLTLRDPAWADLPELDGHGLGGRRQQSPEGAVISLPPFGAWFGGEAGPRT